MQVQPANYTYLPRPASQLDLLLNHFSHVSPPSISRLEASALYRIDSLSRRINDLEELGHKFERVMKHDNTGKRYVRYFYAGRA